MKLKNLASIPGGFVAIAMWWNSFVPPAAQAQLPRAPSSQAEPEQQKPETVKPAGPELNPTALEDRATQILSRYCVSCHGPDKQESDIRLSALETIDAVDRQALFGKAQKVVQLGEMPPEEAKQPNDAERKILLQWLNSQLTGKSMQKDADAELARSIQIRGLDKGVGLSAEAVEKALDGLWKNAPPLA